MSTKKRVKSKSHIICLLTTIFILLVVIPLRGQEKRDHRSNKKNITRNHKTTNKVIVKNQPLNFDEADAIFGTRAGLQRKYPGIKFTRKIHQIKITNELTNGENLIHKTPLGNTVYASVKKGKINGLSLRYPKVRDVKDGTSNTVVYKAENKTCFTCTEYCHPDHFGNTQPCYTLCATVDCSQEHNAEIPGEIVSTIKLTPSPAGPIPIPYPNISTVDTIKKSKKIKIIKGKK